MFVSLACVLFGDVFVIYIIVMFCVVEGKGAFVCWCLSFMRFPVVALYLIVCLMCFVCMCIVDCLFCVFVLLVVLCVLLLLFLCVCVCVFDVV